MFLVGDLAAAVRGRIVAGRADAVIESVSTDSRRLAPGALFWALPGERFDGAAYVADALAAGACGAVVAAGSVPDPAVWRGRDAAIIAVDDPLRALQDAAAAYRSRFAIPVVGVTGSNGKTTTKEMAAAILAQGGGVLKTQGNLNNHIGVPLTVFGLRPDHRAAVVELGVNHHGEMTRLCEIARPTIGVITNIGHAHLEGFGGLEGVARAKGELFASLPADGMALLNADDPHVMALRGALRSESLTFGLGSGDVRGRMIDEPARTGTRVEIRYAGSVIECVIPVVGRHNAANAVSAAAVGVSLGVDLAAVKRGLEAFRPATMRSELVTTASGIDVFNDAYNANPSSMERALAAVGRLRGAGRVWAVLGEMRELGEASESLHRDVGRVAARAGLDGLVAVGPLARWMADEAIKAGMPPRAIAWVETADEAVPVIVAWSRPGDVVLVKGSRRVGLERVVSGLIAGAPSAAT
ncbi:MAG TPA: UDP-N-acetylmuramoyl-tripeptide--D-alanyl-D-alanine ligase [Nitrospiria bacterium]|nr:UDP-N-acetylmuramoyl-tripeptide--D-alanyl-D-alanine ligase [Nitrospiria bacterium]